jgi:hypothetical protein
MGSIGRSRYATFAVLAGQPPNDEPPLPPAKGEHAEPYKNIYGEESFPPVDGVDVASPVNKPLYLTIHLAVIL